MNFGTAVTPSTTFPTGNCKAAKVVDGKIQMPGGNYQVIVVPPCEHMPLETFQTTARAGGKGRNDNF